MKFTDFKKHLATGEYKKVYALVGDDPFLVKSAFGMLVGLVEFPLLNVSSYGDESSSDALCADYVGVPVMSNLRLMKVTLEKRPAAELSRFLAFVEKHPSPDTIAVFVAGGMVSALSASPSKYELVDCNRLDKAMTVKWINRAAADSGAEISGEAASLLADYCLCSLTRIEVELNKLISAKLGETIEESDVAELVFPDGDYKVYELSEAIVKKNVDEVYRIYGNLTVNTPPVVLLGSLYSHFRRLLYASINGDDLDTIARYMKVKPYAMSIAAKQAKLYSPIRLKKIVDKLSKADADFKSGLISDKLALDAFIADTLLSA